MISRHWTAAAVLLAALALLAGGCTRSTPEPPDLSSPASTPSAAATGAVLVDEFGVLTEAAVQSIAPGWRASQFMASFYGLDGYAYGDDCKDSAWTTLSFLETLGARSTTFGPVPTTSERPSVSMAFGELGESERSKVLDAFATQASSCIGADPKGVVRQQPAPEVAGWSGLHQVTDGRDTYWAPVPNGILVVQLDPGLEASGAADRIRRIMTLQLEQAAG